MKIALAQINTTVGDITGNVQKMLDYACRAKEAGAELIIYPELSVCGYPPMDLLLKDSFIQANLEGLHEFRDNLPEIMAIAGFVDINPGSGRPLFNACAFLEGKAIKAVQYKTLLPSYDVFDEDRYFEPAANSMPCVVSDLKFGLSICEDIWTHRQLFPRPRYQMDPVERVVEQSPDLLINISASPFATGKEHIRSELVRDIVRRHHLPVIYVNLVGGNDELIFDGRSFVVDAEGELKAQAKAFEEDLLIVEINPDKKAGKGKKSLSISGRISEFSADRTVNACEALVLGTRDYMHKCGFKKAVIGLSGGIDSAVTAAIAVRAVGKENVLGISMPSPFSSQGSIDDSAALAKNLGIEHKIVPIEKAMVSFDSMLSEVFQGQERDVTEENIQARIRGVTLMAISNKLGYLVLTTGNKSELAVGYCTLYGDMCGGLAVISDLPKMMVYDVARHLNESSGREIIPETTIDKPPSAELRPDQLDQDSLPPYVVLDGILHAYVEQRRRPEEIVRLGYKPEVVQEVITRIDNNEYKRKQAAPGLKVSPRAFGFGWRMPIAQRFREKVLHSGGDSIKMLC